ncbi:hypothetical protein PR048_010739 [Dryococelus australis]|uniref:DDE-1 domain-containing protein n=1 Tax=Dryococelus australis TaxID=614101 RepID=A0ABQ9I3I7_9NEOP|nr:hypothetical protein PR048_010739 [Dryococelus australis]
MAPSEEEFPGLAYAATKNSWMEVETFGNHFLRNIRPDKPAIFIYDGHCSHTPLELLLKARQENIVILKPLKLNWDEELIKWQRIHYGKKLLKSMFSSFLSRYGEHWIQK